MKWLKKWTKKAMTGLRNRWTRVRRQFYEDTVLLALLVVILAVVGAILIYWNFPTVQEKYWEGVFIEFHGMIFDIVVFGLLIAIFSRIISKRREIVYQQEIIDDFKKLDSDEAKYRIAGAIRRINRRGRTDIDFGGIDLRKFSFRGHDIKSIKGSVFYDGTWGTMGSRDKVLLENVDFFAVDCRDVVFSKFNPFRGLIESIEFATFKDCSFADTNLSNAVFNGAHLEWSKVPPDKLGVWHDMPDDQPVFEQTHYPAFWHVDISGVSFEDVTLNNADFRQANNVLQANFKGAMGLESCVFDDEKTKKAVIEKASAGKRKDTE